MWQKIKERIPLKILIIQGIFVIAILIYSIMVIDGGVFTTFYSWLFALLVGLIVTGITFFKRHIILGAIDLAVLILVFLHLYTLPF